MTTATRIAALAVLLAALGGCQPIYQDAALGLGGKAQPYARSYADPSSPRPDLPPDRDARKD